MILRTNEKNSFDIKARKIRGINITAFMVANAVATPLQNQDFVPQNITLKLQLQRKKRNGQLSKTIIFSDNLKVLGMETAIGTGLMQFISPANGTGTPLILVPNGVAVIEEAIIPVKIDLGSVIDLRNDDTLSLTISSNGQEWGGNADASASFLEVNWFEGSGQEFATPIIQTDSVSSGESNNVYNVGDCVRRVVFINIRETDTQTANQIIDTVNVTTASFQTSDTWNELQSYNASQINGFDYLFNAQSAILMNTQQKLQNQVAVDIQFIATNISGGQNYIVSRKYISDKDLYTSAQVKAQNADANEVQKLITTN